MKKILKLMKRELDKIFKDPRVVFTTIVLPGLILFIMYTLFGTVSKEMSQDLKDHSSVIEICGDVSALDGVFSAMDTNITIKKVEQLPQIENIKERIENGDIDLFVKSYGVVDGKLKVDIFTDTSNTFSSNAYTRFSTVLNVYQQIILQTEGIDISRYQINDIKDFTEGDSVTIMIFSMMLPMMIVIMLFANAMGVSAESITGEKERGTLATLIMTPIKRSDIIFAKVLSNTVISLLTAISSFIGMLFSMDNMVEVIGANSSATYGIGDYLSLLVPILCIALLSVSLFSIAGTIAKTMKEANALSMPLYICGIVCSIMAAYQNVPPEWYYYLIPIYNCTLCMKAVFSFSFSTVNMLISLVSSIAVFVLISLVLSHLFKKEKVLFSY